MKTLLRKLKLITTGACLIGMSQNGVSQAASIIMDINTGSANSLPNVFTVCGGLNCIFFVADNGITGAELWKYDIATKTSTLVKDINPGATGSGITSITSNFAGNGIIFNANDGTSGNELWKSDGTSAGTSMVVDINPGAGSSNPSNFYPYGGTFICSADNGTNGKEPWLTNGTSGGTAMLKDINSGSGASDPNNFTAVNGNLLFRANDGITGSELWKTDMTSGGTLLVKDINTGTVSSVPQNFAVLGSNLIFSAIDANGAELWKSDGTLSGTMLVKDINAGAGSSMNMTPGAKGFFTTFGSAVYFQATDGSTGYEFWKTDGTTVGTSIVKDIQTGSAASNPSGLLATTTSIYFFANDGTTGMEPWISDGTTVGTTLLKDINVGSGASTTSTSVFVKSASGPVYFAASDGVNGNEFWRSMGNTASTTLIADINPGSGSSNPANMLVVSNNVYFSATDGTTGVEPWTFDPLAAGIKEIGKNDLAVNIYPNPSKGQLFISTTEEKISVSVYSAIGTVVYVNNFDNASGKQNLVDLNELNSGIYFVKIKAGQKETVRKVILNQ
jgi:ELWxxDGT repeat protein